MSGLGFGHRKLIEKIILTNWKLDKPELKKYNYNELLFIIQEMLEEEGKPYLEHGSTVNRGHHIFRAFIKHLLYRNIANYDSMVLLSSNKGTGKSSAAMMMAKEWCRLIGIRFDPNRHIAYNNDDVINKIDNLKKFEPIICVSGDTLVTVRFGISDTIDKIKVLPVRKLVGEKRKYDIFVYDTKKNYGVFCRPEGCIKTHDSVEVFKVELENGVNVKATEDHMFLTEDGYKKLKDLRANDSVVICGKYRTAKISVDVKSVTKTEERESVYDIIGVKKHHNFIANGMVVHNCDESVRFASASDWAIKSHKILKKKLAQVRTKHLLYILCFPLKVQKLEKTYLESFTNYWVDLYARGEGVVYVKDNNPAQDSWRLNMFKDVGGYNEFTSSTHIRDKLKKHPNFWSTIKFPKPSEALYTKYLSVREKNVYDDENVLKSVSKEDMTNALLVLALRDVMMNDSSLSMNRIILHLSSEYDIKIPKSAVNASIEDAKQLVLKMREKAISYSSS